MATGLSADRITDKQIVIMLSRLAKHIVWCKNKGIDDHKNPRTFYYTDGNTELDENGRYIPDEDEFPLRNIFQFCADGPLLTK